MIPLEKINKILRDEWRQGYEAGYRQAKLDNKQRERK